MEKYIIRGGSKLNGEVTVNGSKNSAVAIIAASILLDKPCTIENIPDILDVSTMVDLVQRIGAKVTRAANNRMLIDPANVSSWKAPYDLVKNMRASYYLLGALLGKFSRAEVALPLRSEKGTMRMRSL